MSDKKIVNQLPVVLQTKAVKNFFEATVEQLYSEANTTPLAGFIGKKTGEDYGLTGAFLKEDNADRRQYNLSPAVNNINPITGDSENLVFYDEFIDTLGVYGVNTSNHNRIFGSKFRVFMPPIEIDKFINYQEYYWSLTGPSVSTITATAVLPINIEKDVLGQKSYTYKTLTLRNGMVLVFSDNNNTIPAGTTASSNKAGVEYIVGGVGEGIYLTPKLQTTSTLYGGSKATTKDYITMQRGSGNSNAWSRTNHWYHRNNFTDVGDKLPARTYRANRPIIEFMTFNFALVGIDQIINNAAKIHQMSGGQFPCPIVFRGPTASAGQLAATHSQAFESWYANCPGLKVIVPSNPYDAKGLLKAAIRDNDPVIFMESEQMYGDKGEVPEEEYILPIGFADIKRSGDDVTVVSFGKIIKEAYKAADALEKEGISCEIIDLRTIRPLDIEAIFTSVKKTNRLVILEESWPFGNISTEITYQVQNEVFDYLDAPIEKINTADTPAPFSPVLFKEWLPNSEDVIASVKKVMYFKK